MLGYPSPRPQKFEWSVWHCLLIYWPGNGRPPWVIFVPQINIIHEIGDVTAEWPWGYRSRSKVIARDTSSCICYGGGALCHIVDHSRGGISITFQISGKDVMCIYLLPHCVPCIMELILSYGHHICQTESYLHFDSCMHQQSWCSKHVFWIKLSNLWVAYE